MFRIGMCLTCLFHTIITVLILKMCVFALLLLPNYLFPLTAVCERVIQRDCSDQSDSWTQGYKQKLLNVWINIKNAWPILGNTMIWHLIKKKLIAVASM